MFILTFKNSCTGIIEFCLKQIGIFCRDDSVIRKSAMFCPLAITKLIQILTDVFQIY